MFQPSAGLSRQSFVLGESKTAQDKAEQLNRQFGPAADQNWLEADVRYQLILAGPPGLINAKGADIPTAGIGETARYFEDLFRSPGDVIEEKARRSEERESARKKMREVVAARLSFGSLSVELSSRSFVQDDGNFRVHVQLDIPGSDLATHIGKEKLSQGISRIELYCALVGEKGNIVDEFIYSMEVYPSTLASLPSGNLHYLNSFNVPPGNYILKAAVRSSETARLGYTEKPIQVTRDREVLALSDLLVTNHVKPADSSTSPAGDRVILGDTSFLLNPRQEFGPSDRLIVYFQILLPRGKDLQDSDLSVGVNFIAGDQVVRRLETRKVVERNSQVPGVINFATSVPLDQFPPGNYTMQVQALDHTSKKFSIQRTSFTIARNE